MATKILPISDLRRQLNQIIGEMQQDSEVVYITQHGRPAAVLVEYEQYEALLAQLKALTGQAGLKAPDGESDSEYEAFLAEIMGNGEV